MRHARGIALITALFVMIAVVIASLSAARAALQGEKTARGERDHAIAFHAAEAALADAEHAIEGGAKPALGDTAWQALALDDSAVTSAYGDFTGALMPIGAATLPARVPRYVIYPAPGKHDGSYYLITVIGSRTRQTRVVLQALYRKAAASPQGRLGWREIANWQELHEAATK